MKGCIYIISDLFESSEIEGSANLNTKFQDVWKFPDMSRLYHPSFFGARINVSPKEFLWNPSFNADLFFFRDSGYLNLTKTSESDVWER